MNLLVGIDTEGDNQWDAAARADQRFENIYALPRLHALFAQHGVRPTYVITYPVATDARSAEVLRGLLGGGDCEIGAHHHAWETPPCTADDVAAASVRVNDPAAAVRAAARVADDGDYRGGRRSRRSPTDPAGSGLPPSTSPGSSGSAISSNRASRRSSTRRTRAALISSRRR